MEEHDRIPSLLIATRLLQMSVNLDAMAMDCHCLGYEDMAMDFKAQAQYLFGEHAFVLQQSQTGGKIDKPWRRN